MDADRSHVAKPQPEKAYNIQMNRGPGKGWSSINTPHPLDACQVWVDWAVEDALKQGIKNVAYRIVPAYGYQNEG